MCAGDRGWSLQVVCEIHFIVFCLKKMYAFICPYLFPHLRYPNHLELVRLYQLWQV